MDTEKKKRLEAAGFMVGGATGFLGLTSAEESLIELRLALSRDLKRQRARHNLSQAALARALRSSQSRVAKMEAGDPSVSLDLLIRALLTAGATREELGEVIGAPQ
jgi:DNA-binding XRE family transcriptional regulator